MTDYQKRIARYGKACPWLSTELIPDEHWWWLWRGRELKVHDCEAVWWEAAGLRRKQREEGRRAA